MSVSWENDYMRPTWCPYCGHQGRDRIRDYRGAWFRLQCKECGKEYEVRMQKWKRER